MNEISDTVLKQRLRNRLIEALENFFDDKAIISLGTNEIMKIWYDYADNEQIAFYDEPIFSSAELNQIKSFSSLLDFSYESIPSSWQLREIESCLEWKTLASAARDAYDIFMKRGFSEDF